MTTGTAILLLAVLGAVGFAAYRARTDGLFRDVGVGRVRSGSRSQSRREQTAPTVGAEIVARVSGAQFGQRATLVQFSSAFCAPCRTTRVLLADIAGSENGVHHLELDAEQHLDLVRALDVRRTPTTLVLDAAGRELVRAAGLPQRHQVLAVLPVEVTS